eukprot:393344_1
MAFLNNLKCTRLCKFQYQQQLEQLEKLGYTDTKHIKKKLKQYNGNANQVIADYLKDDDASAMNEETTDYVELLRVALTQLKLIYIEDLCIMIQSYLIRSFEYKSDCDRDGIIYFLGCDYGKCDWQNASEKGIIEIKSTELGWNSGTIHHFVDRDADRCLSIAITDWFSVDFKGLQIKPTHYALRRVMSMGDLSRLAIYEVGSLREVKMDENGSPSNNIKMIHRCGEQMRRIHGKCMDVMRFIPCLGFE